ncbi:serine hydrolase domain-containing protein [Cupriavidus sp. USMAHM13]|uniref:serine hydrolase domain-containing protein n=1 Tax=Cupriavidus sp. USMAHM13 TaxID=1389192 RepID=UPI0018D362BD|nr:serine hydrolase domain-containing protein [Cupriavidus sp. USMAHM13]
MRGLRFRLVCRVVVALGTICALAAPALPAHAASAATFPDFTTPPEQIARAVLADEPGTVAVGIWRQDHEQSALLRRASEDGPAMVQSAAAGAEPLFEIGSISKLFTGLLLAQAVEHGELGLDDSLGTLLGGAYRLAPETAAITLRQLATHGACLPREAPGFPGYTEPNPFAAIDRQRLYAAVAGLRLAHAPPCAGAYSNFGMGLLGQLLADHYGKPWATLVRERITGPLGMHDTMQVLGARQERLVPGHFHLEPAPPWDFDALAGAGALRSSTTDLLAFARALSAGSAGPLGPAATRMLTPLGRYRAGEIGYAVMMRGTGAHRTYFHDGLTAGYRALLVFAPDTGEAAALLAANTHAEPSRLLTGVLARRYPPAATARGTPSDAELAAVSGSYRVDRDTLEIFAAQDGRLYRRLSGGGFRPLEPAGTDTFIDAPVGAEFVFRRQDGRVAGVDLYQGGGSYSASRTEAAAPAAVVIEPARAADYDGRYAGKRLLRTELKLDVRQSAGQLGVRLGNFWRQPVFPLPGRPDRFVFEDGRAQLQFTRDAGGKVDGAVLYDRGVISVRRLP